MKKKGRKQKQAPAAAPGRKDRKSAMRARSGLQPRRPEPAPGPSGYPIGKGRRALKGISIYMHPLAKEVLDKIALEQNRTVQDLGLEALNLLFRHYGEKPIA
jgi:hypothetical protein